MRTNKIALLGIAVLALTLAAGCAKPPQVEIDATKASLSQVEADASRYAADAWNKAQQAVNAVNAEVEAQANKFALFRSYTKTKELNAAASQAIADAKTAAAEAKEAAKNAANETLAAAKASLDAANTAMADLAKCRRQPKDFKKDMELMRGNYDGLAAQVAGIESAVASEDYLGAKAQAESLKASVDTLNADLASAKEKIKC
jgi:multidrug efflux pump subunit AcrA (membrane-fusion protein)